MARSPLARLLAGALVLHLVGIGWGLPGSDGWDDDGIAPRDFLVGTYMTYRPSHYFTYPPVHLVLLTLLTLPATLLGLARAASWAPHDVIAELTRVPTMTALALTARLVTEAMALGVVYVVARIAQELWGRRAGLWAAGMVASNVVFTYYAHTSNLDVPYAFWSLLALLSLVRALVRKEPRRLRHCAGFAVLAIGTKDQAYALFLLTLPLAIACWLATDTWARDHRWPVLREVALSLLGGGLLLLLADGAVTNPLGFAARVRFLTGSASRDHAYYALSWAGGLRVLVDSGKFFDRYYPLGLVPFVAYGTYLQGVKTRTEPARAVAGWVPLFAVVSFTLAFNCVARRTEHRFLLPQSLLIALYAGLAFDTLTSRFTRPFASVSLDRVTRAAVWIAAAILGGRALFECIGVDVALLRDPRYDAEAWLRDHVADGDSIEVYGNNVYLPRLPPDALVTRLDSSPIGERSPMPGMRESDQRYDLVEQRRPDWIVLSEGWVWRYTITAPADPSGAVGLAPVQLARQQDVAARAYFESLFAGTGSYRQAHVSRYDDSFWPRVDIHASTTRTIYVFRRARR